MNHGKTIVALAAKLILVIVGGWVMLIAGPYFGLPILHRIGMLQVADWAFPVMVGVVTGILASILFRRGALPAVVAPISAELFDWFGLGHVAQTASEETVYSDGHLIRHSVEKLHADYSSLILLVVLSAAVSLLVWGCIFLLKRVRQRKKSLRG